MARERGRARPNREGEVHPDADEVLWAKYLDYCSARVCEVFMELEEEQVFELARAVEARAGVSQGSLNFREIAALLVEKLLGDLSLPDFESWSREYRRSPEKYDPHLLGLWRSGLEHPTTSSNL